MRQFQKNILAQIAAIIVATVAGVIIFYIGVSLFAAIFWAIILAAFIYFVLSVASQIKIK